MTSAEGRGRPAASFCARDLVCRPSDGVGPRLSVPLRVCWREFGAETGGAGGTAFFAYSSVQFLAVYH